MSGDIEIWEEDKPVSFGNDIDSPDIVQPLRRVADLTGVEMAILQHYRGTVARIETAMVDAEHPVIQVALRHGWVVACAEMEHWAEEVGLAKEELL